MAGKPQPRRWLHLIVILVAALLMTWPAAWNGFPLMYFGDSLAYMEFGKVVARALFLGDPSGFYGDRSLIYGLGILPFHLNASPWPVVGLNASLTAYVLWLLVRSLVPQRAVVAYFSLMVSISVLTGLGWYVSFLMPDILGPLIYLSFYLLAFCRNALSRGEQTVLAFIAWWAITSHATHLPIAAGLIVVITFVFIFRRASVRQWLPGVGRLAAIMLASIMAQVTLNAYLYKEVRLFNSSIPFLLTRVVTDPPGQLYLERRCRHPDLAICAFVNELPDETWEFLWDETSVWQSSSEEIRQRLLEEEMLVVRGVISTYPWDQLRISLGYFFTQLWTVGLYHVANSNDWITDDWIAENMERVMPGVRSGYFDSRQSEKTLHEQFFERVQAWSVLTSLGFVLFLLLFFKNRWSAHAYALLVVIAYVLVANAALTAVVSQVADRYQGRVVWLLPLLAGLLLFSRPAAHPQAAAQAG